MGVKKSLYQEIDDQAERVVGSHLLTKSVCFVFMVTKIPARSESESILSTK